MSSRQIDDEYAEKKQQIARLISPTWDMIYTFPDKEWDWEKISMDKSITYDIVLSNPKHPWVPVHFIRDSFFQTLPDNTILEIIRNNMDFPWYGYHISIYIDINKEQDQKLVIDNPEMRWNWHLFSKNIENLNFIRKTSDRPWDWESLCVKKHITWEFILEFADKNWSWYTLSEHSQINWGFVLEHPELPWDWVALSFREVTLDIVNSLAKYPWDTEGLSYQLPLLDIIGNPTAFSWNWASISKREDLTKKIIMENTNIPWDFKIISERLCNGML
jgi:hypothetical protein